MWRNWCFPLSENYRLWSQTRTDVLWDVNQSVIFWPQQRPAARLSCWFKGKSCPTKVKLYHPSLLVESGKCLVFCWTMQPKIVLKGFPAPSNFRSKPIVMVEASVSYSPGQISTQNTDCESPLSNRAKICFRMTRHLSGDSGNWFAMIPPQSYPLFLLIPSRVHNQMLNQLLSFQLEQISTSLSHWMPHARHHTTALTSLTKYKSRVVLWLSLCKHRCAEPWTSRSRWVIRHQSCESARSYWLCTLSTPIQKTAALSILEEI